MSGFNGTRVSPSDLIDRDIFYRLDGQTNITFPDDVRYQFVRENGRDVGVAVSTIGREKFRCGAVAYFFSGSGFFDITNPISSFPTIEVNSSGGCRTI